MSRNPAPLMMVLSDEDASRRFARRLAELARAGDVFFLRGDMGSGKSFFARAFIRARSEDETLDVPSPTFSLVQSYDVAPQAHAAQGQDAFSIHHFDLWRLADPADLAELDCGERDVDMMLVEWPDKGEGFLPAPDWELEFEMINAAEEDDGTRAVHVRARDPRRLEKARAVLGGRGESA